MKKVPTDFRRVTMMVNQMEPALTIYRDILGMEVHYDHEIVVSGKGIPAGEPDSKARLVILKCNDSYIGMLGHPSVPGSAPAGARPAACPEPRQGRRDRVRDASRKC